MKPAVAAVLVRCASPREAAVPAPLKLVAALMRDVMGGLTFFK